MVDLKETLDILRNLESLKWKQTSYDMEEENIRNPKNEMSFGRKMLCPLCLISIYVIGRLLGGKFLICIFLVIISAVAWRILSKFIHLRKPAVNQQLDELFYKRKKIQRRIDNLNNRLMDSVVPSEYLSISFVEKLIEYIDSGQVQSLSEGILLLNIETIQQQIDDKTDVQNERIEQLERELKKAKRQLTEAQKAADAARSRATSAELRSFFKK